MDYRMAVVISKTSTFFVCIGECGRGLTHSVYLTNSGNDPWLFGCMKSTSQFADFPIDLVKPGSKPECCSCLAGMCKKLKGNDLAVEFRNMETK